MVGIQTGGSKRPFFCVHPAGGTVHAFIPLSRRLGPDQPLYGLQAAGLEGEQEPYTRIEDMAARYVEAIRAMQPEGPYMLGGWSLGGAVAFEMAQQLHREGQEVALLAILDTAAPSPLDNFEPPEDGEVLASVIGSKSLPMPYDDFRRLELDEQIHIVLTWAKEVGVLPPDAGPPRVHRFLQVFKANVAAMARYAPQVYQNRITLFRTHAPIEDEILPETATDTQLSDPTRGWSALSSQPVEVYTVPGSHTQIVLEPHVRTLAEQLQNCLDAAQSTSNDSSSTTAMVMQMEHGLREDLHPLLESHPS